MSPAANRWALAAAVVLIPTAGMATAVIAETIEQMAQGAPLVVRGRVAQIQAQWDERAERISTYADIQVTEVLKGQRLGNLLVKSPGGELGGRGQAVAGAAQFLVGQDTVLFLEPAVDERNVWILRALAAGKVDLERTPTGEVRAARHLEGLAFFERATGRPTVKVVHPEEDLGPADAFLRRVRHTLDGAR